MEDDVESLKKIVRDHPTNESTTQARGKKKGKNYKHQLVS